ncbi:hypothetical protein Tco_1094456, partial [Tanacetum coccineum]
TVGTHDDEAESSRPKRSRQYEIVEEAMLPRVHHEFLTWGTCPSLNLLEFARRLGLYHSEEVNEEAFDVYFQGSLRSDDKFNVRDYWLSISRDEELHLSRSDLA